MSLPLRLLFLALCALSSAVAQELTLKTVAADQKIWPHRVTTTAPIEIAADAKTPARSLPTGTTLSVKEIKPTGIVVDLDGAEVLVPAAPTDLLTRAATIAAQVLALSGVPAGAYSPSSYTSSESPAATAPSAPVRSTSSSSVTNQIAADLTGDLVSLEGGRLKNFDTAVLLPKKYLLVYYSAHWCGPCRAFTPELVNWYNSVSSQHDKFDIVFYSNDRSEADMLTYMLDTNMPWPALDYRKTRLHNVLAKYAGSGIPDLVLLDDRGNVLSDSFQGDTYLGPSKVANDLARLLRHP